MKSGGRTKVTDIGMGRKILCREKPSTRATSACAKRLAKTIATAKKGLTPKQQKLWRDFVYEPLALKVSAFCSHRTSVRRCGHSHSYSRSHFAYLQKSRFNFKQCAFLVLWNQLKFKDTFAKEHTWSDYLISGAKLVKKHWPKPSVPDGT